MRTVSDVFRDEWPRLVATLVRDLRDVSAAEDAAQDAFEEAAARWTPDAMPDKPGAWLLTTARRKAIDRARRSTRGDALLGRLARSHPDIAPDASERLDRRLDDRLALIVGCCHPALTAEAQVALTLRIVGGLSTAQIAQAFFVSDDTMTRRLTRAKDKIRVAEIPFDTPDGETLRERLPVVCGVIHSIFTEGHTSAASTELVRGDLCDEAIWLGELLVGLVPGDPEVLGLVALMVLIDARRSTRTDADGVPVLLADQDRSQWDRARIADGLALLARAHAHHAGGVYQLHASIAALHATAASFESTNWSGIVALYDAIARRRPTAQIALNRAIALAEAAGPAAGLAAIDAIGSSEGDEIDGSPYLHGARGELLARLGRDDEAIAALDRAATRTRNVAERELLTRRRSAIARRSRRPGGDGG